MKNNRDIYYPKHFMQVKRTSDYRGHKMRKYYDPLYFEHEYSHINGGMTGVRPTANFLSTSKR